MIVISMLLVVVAAVTLGIGVFIAEDNLTIIWVAIGAALLAGVFLVIGLLRSRPSRKPVLASGGDEKEAQWAKSSSWGGGRGGQADTLARDDDEPLPSNVQVVTAGPERATAAEDEHRELFAPSDSPDAAAADGDDDVIVVPKASARTAAGARGGARATKAAATPAGRTDDAVAVVPIVPARKATATKATAKKAAAKKAAAKKAATSAGPAKKAATSAGPAKKAATSAAPAKKATAKKATAKKATAKKATAKKATAKKATARSAVPTATESERFDEALSSVRGVGDAKRADLLAEFGTLRRLKAASPGRIAQVPGVSDALAKRIADSLRPR